VRSWKLQADDGGWQLPIVGCNVGRCIVDYAFALEFHESEQAVLLRIEGSFLVSNGQYAQRLNPEEPAELGPGLALVHRVVQSARASSEGKIEISFEGGHMIAVEPDLRFEAWEICGPSGMRVVCGPGGRMSVWQPAEAEP